MLAVYELQACDRGPVDLEKDFTPWYNTNIHLMVSPPGKTEENILFKTYMSWNHHGHTRRQPPKKHQPPLPVPNSRMALHLQFLICCKKRLHQGQWLCARKSPKATGRNRTHATHATHEAGWLAGQEANGLHSLEWKCMSPPVIIT